MVVENIATLGVIFALVSLFSRDRKVQIITCLISVALALVFIGAVTLDDCKVRVEGECVVQDEGR